MVNSTMRIPLLAAFGRLHITPMLRKAPGQTRDSRCLLVIGSLTLQNIVIDDVLALHAGSQAESQLRALVA